MEAQQQFQQQLQQPPEGLQQALRDAKASLPVLPRPPEPIKHALDALADATLGRFGKSPLAMHCSSMLVCILLVIVAEVQAMFGNTRTDCPLQARQRDNSARENG